MRSTKEELPADTDQATLLALIDKLNADPEVNGILVQLPLPDQIDSGVAVSSRGTLVVGCDDGVLRGLR